MNIDPAIKLEHVVITGAASGIGAACAKKLKQTGVRVTALDLHRPDYDIDQYIALDMNEESSIDNAVSIAVQSGPFDALFNIAGVPPRENQQQSVITINWLGQRRLTNALLPHLNRGGAIVNMASRAGAQWLQNINQVKAVMEVPAVDGLADFFAAHPINATRAYMLSKEAMIVWTMNSAAALQKSGVRMNSVSPAAVSTGILDDFKAAFGDKVSQNLATVGRAGTADEIADVTLFLASPQSHWLRGVDIVVDGGMSAIAQTDMLGMAAD